MSARDYYLFREYPLDGKARLSCGEVPTPYHAYKGWGALIGGTADLQAVKELTAGAPLELVCDSSGRALMTIRILTYTETSLGAHTELQFSFFTSPDLPLTVPAHRLSALQVLLNEPQASLVCHGLWNNLPKVVTYNRELLRLDARLGQAKLEPRGQQMYFQFEDWETDAPLLSGALHDPMIGSFQANWALGRLIGFRALSKINRGFWIDMTVVNARGEAKAGAMSHNDLNALRYFKPGQDTLVFGETPYAGLDFQPGFVQFMDGCKLVYLNPEGK